MGHDAHRGPPAVADGDGPRIAMAIDRLRQRWVTILAAMAFTGLVAFGATFLMKPVYTATTLVMPPQQSQGGGMAALASLSLLPGMASLAGGGLRNTGDQYIALLQSVTVADRIIDQFKLQAVYDEKFKTDTRRELADNVRIRLSKKDGMIAIDVDDSDPQRAADMANRYVVELGRMTDTLAVTEAQQRRVFFERQLQSSRDRLTSAQRALLASGFNPDALKTEPRAAADLYARRKAEVTVAEVQLQALRQSLTDAAPEVKSLVAALAALRAELARLEHQTKAAQGPDYVGAYRDFKYQEAQFEILARQLELARIDESREGALIQVVDPAQAPERRSRPRRSLIALAAAAACALLFGAWAILVPPRRAGKIPG